jgi:acetyl esterase/lipase
MLAAQNILELPPPKDGEHIAYGTDQFQFGDLRVPAGAGPHPVVIVIHGGYWRAAYDLKHIGHLCAAITAAGFATWSMEYRRWATRAAAGRALSTIFARARHI